MAARAHRREPYLEPVREVPGPALVIFKLLPDAQGRMPQGGPYLDEAALRDVAGWICSGALEPASPSDGGADNPVPTLSNLNPSNVATHGAPFTLTLTGTGFIPTSTVAFNGADVTTAYVGADTLTARIPTLAMPGGYSFTVRNPAPGGGTSNALSATPRKDSEAGGFTRPRQVSFSLASLVSSPLTPSLVSG